MKIRLYFIILQIFFSVVFRSAADDDLHWVKTSRDEWREYVQEKFPVGTSEKEIEVAMKNKYIAKIKWPYPQGGTYDVSYRVDDITEIVFNFSKKGILKGSVAVIPHRIWVRNPINGHAWIIKEKAK